MSPASKLESPAEEKARCDHRCLSTAALAAIAAVLSETFPPLNDAIS
jgi:hypothetical protein